MAVNSVNTGVGLTGGPITDTGTISLVAATSILLGGVTLVTSTSSASTTQAATPASVKVAYDASVDASALANTKLPLSGGTMTGPIVFAAGQTFNALFLPVATPTSQGVVIPSTGLAISPGGYLTTVNNGTVTSVIAGTGLGAPFSGNAITSSGTIKLLPPSSDGAIIGGVRAGSNISIQIDGEISTEGVLKTNNIYSYNSYLWPATTSPIPGAPGSNGQVLTLLDRVTGEIAWTSTGGLNSVASGAGITVTTIGKIATVGLTPVPSLVSGTFGATALIPTFTVNSYGQLTSAGLANPYSPFQIATTTAPPDLVLDFNTNNTNWEWTLQGNTTIQNPLNAQPGMTGSILLSQNPATPAAVTWGAAWKFANFTPYTGNPTAAAVDFIQFTVVSSNYVVVTNIVPNIG
jgi:hypothetical protein